MAFPSILRSPLAHFLVLGALCFAAREPIGELVDVFATEPPVTIDAERIDALRRDWQAEMGREPTRAELERLVENEIDDELLYREARERGLDADDPGIELRLLQKMSFLDDAAADADPAALVEQARVLGLEQEDVVVRRLLVQKLRLQATTLSSDEQPSDEALARAFAERRESLREPERRSLVHVFLSRDRRGEGLEAEADALHDQIERDAIPPMVAMQQGDAFPLGVALERRSQDELARSLGEEFAAAAFALEPGRWSRPIGSPYGLHLVQVERVEAGAIPALEAVRIPLLRTLEEEARDRKLAALLAELRTRYEVAVAEGGEERE